MIIINMTNMKTQIKTQIHQIMFKILKNKLVL